MLFDVDGAACASAGTASSRYANAAAQWNGCWRRKKGIGCFLSFWLSSSLSLSLCIVRRLFRLIGSCFNVLVVSAGVGAYSISCLFFF